MQDAAFSQAYESGAAMTTTAPAVDIGDNRPLCDLTQFGVGAGEIKRLSEAGVTTIKAVLMRTSRDLCEIKGLSENKVEKVQDAARRALFGEGASAELRSAATVLSERQNLYRLATGVPAVDDCLGGGYEACSLTEIFGEARMGKSQLCHWACVRAAADGYRSVYIDTEGTFRPERIEQMAAALDLDGPSVLNMIIYARAHTHEQQLALLQACANKIADQATDGGGQYRVLVVDSVTALFRSEFTGRGQLSERQQILGRYLHALTKLADEYQLVVLMTNQVCADPGNGLAFAASAMNKPIGGNILAHASTTRISLRRGKANSRVMKIYDSPSLPETDAAFMITESGIMEAD